MVSPLGAGGVDTWSNRLEGRFGTVRLPSLPCTAPPANMAGAVRGLEPGFCDASSVQRHADRSIQLAVAAAAVVRDPGPNAAGPDPKDRRGRFLHATTSGGTAQVPARPPIRTTAPIGGPPSAFRPPGTARCPTPPSTPSTPARNATWTACPTLRAEGKSSTLSANSFRFWQTTHHSREGQSG